MPSHANRHAHKQLQLWGVKQGIFPHYLILYSLSFLHQDLQQLPQAFVTGQVEPFNQIDNTHPSKALERWG